ncbi:rod shape-determining protein MreC [Candidatus Gottesmanbacteria bacterium]|nr:rod shape-determining protein MreC [Candidatus Gottesmanbacteria bacterium]
MEKEKTGRILPLFLFLLLLCLFLVLAENFGAIKSIQGAVEKVTVPVKISIYRIWQGGLGDAGQGQKREELERQVRESSVLAVKLKLLEEENQALRRQLEAPLPPTMKFLPAKTIGLTRYLTIDKGEEDGVREGTMVVSENILLGKIISLTPKTAQVLLPTDPDSKIPSRTLKTGAKGLAIGEFGTKLSLAKVLQAEVLEVGDLVVTSGEGGYVRDLLIGKIAKIEKIPVEPFQKGEIAPLLDYQRLVNVFVITN